MSGLATLVEETSIGVEPILLCRQPKFCDRRHDAGRH